MIIVVIHITLINVFIIYKKRKKIKLQQIVEHNYLLILWKKFLRGLSQMMSAPKGGGGVSEMLTKPDMGGGGV